MMNRNQRARLLRERYRALNPKAQLRGVLHQLRVKSAVPDVPAKIYLQWPQIIPDATQRAPRWFMAKEQEEPGPKVRPKRRTKGSPLTRIAGILTDPQQLQAICLDQRKTAG